MDPEDQLDEARLLIRNGDYDQAITLLKQFLGEALDQTSYLQDGYLLLIRSYVFLGNYYRFQAMGRETSELSYTEARKIVTDCLRTEGLRHTVPDRESGDPPEMIEIFADVRRQIFGSIKIDYVTPPDAAVTFNGDTLKVNTDDGTRGDHDLPIGPHTVEVFHPGHQTISEEITISPNSVLERSYELQKERNRIWWLVAGVGVTTAAIVALVGGDEGSSTDPGAETLPEPPPPPD